MLDNVPNQISTRKSLADNKEQEYETMWATKTSSYRRRDWETMNNRRETTSTPTIQNDHHSNVIRAKLQRQQQQQPKQISEPRNWLISLGKAFSSLLACFGMQTMSNVIASNQSPTTSAHLLERAQVGRLSANSSMESNVNNLNNNNNTGRNYKHQQFNGQHYINHRHLPKQSITSVSGLTTSNTTNNTNTYSSNSSVVHLPSVEGSLRSESTCPQVTLGAWRYSFLSPISVSLCKLVFLFFFID